MPADETSVTTARSVVALLPADKSTAVQVGQRQRFAGLSIVLAVAFSSSIITSLLRVCGVHFDYPDAWLGYQYFNIIVHQLISLALLAYVVSENRQTPASLGLVFRATDIVYGVLLWIVSECCYRLAFPTIVSVCELLGWHKTPPYYPSSKMGIVLIACCFIVVNPVFEELIVRAFLISEILTLIGSSALAVMFSVLLQTSYHLYQGLPYALALGLIFIIFSTYYSRTRRILPVIVAHFIMDLSFFRPI